MSPELRGGADTDRRAPGVGVGARDLPPMSPATRDLLSRRLPVRQPAGSVAGRPLWLPRLGVTVLPHEPVTRGWLCSFVAADTHPVRLPVGLWLVDEVEITTGFAVPASWPLRLPDGLAGDEFAAAWLVRVVEVDCCRYGTAAALLAGFDPDTLTVVADDAARRRAGPRTTDQAFQAVLARLRAAGFLFAPHDSVPPVVGTQPCPPPTDVEDGAHGGGGLDGVLAEFAAAASVLPGRPVTCELCLPRPGWPR